jgi:excisionase family DNA binding protein
MREPRQVMDIGDAAEYLQISRDTLYKYASEKKVPAFKLGNRWRFMKAQVDQWMIEQCAKHGKEGLDATKEKSSHRRHE